MYILRYGHNAELGCQFNLPETWSTLMNVAAKESTLCTSLLMVPSTKEEYLTYLQINAEV